ncbi:heat shock 70 kDa protein 15-like protein [Tanacetum coccineum]
MIKRVKITRCLLWIRDQCFTLVASLLFRNSFFNEYDIRNMILHTENSFLSLLFIVSEKDSIRLIQLDTAYGSRVIRRIGNWSNALPCEVQALIRRISFAGYDVEALNKKVKKSNIPVSEVVYRAMLPADVQQAVEKEFEMALQDRVMEETKDKKNVVEAYLHDKLLEFVTDSDSEQLIAKLQETEDWLYEDGEYVTTTYMYLSLSIDLMLMQVEAPKKKVNKSNIPVSEVVYGAMLPADVQQAVEKEFEMALQDCVVEETKDKKNVVEAYFYQSMT